MADQDAQDGIDRSPIGQPEHRNALEKALQTRSEEQQLKDRHILLDTTAAPALQAKQAELERQRITDNLKKGLGKRPEKGDLVEKNILPNSTASPGLQERQKELEKHIRKDSLQRHLQARPTPESLVNEGILQADENPIAER
ncbi:hypothetical protein LTR22_013860 [Elasticomyces elasticus]|nr:hypothetical protein LTR22_013860 [Elasticomyces elasticus]KAK5752898.1 hypothetical protein LTS12_016970 [Elasticomyces elasticus]